ncbi:hypothetical protein AAG906_021066 [Vitis piasezkii]
MADSDRKIHDSRTLVDGNLLAAKAFAAAGVTLMFGVVGILVTSFAKRAVSILIRFLAFHNEQSAGYAASAYGYLTGKAGLLLIVSGPGCVHCPAGLSNATANAWSMVMISEPFKVLDQALSGRRLVLDLSNDILHQTVSLSEAGESVGMLLKILGQSHNCVIQ